MSNLANNGSRIWHYLKMSVSSPLVRSCLVMTVSLCSTFIGYEYARAASITLLAAKVCTFKIARTFLAYLTPALVQTLKINTGNWVR